MSLRDKANQIRLDLFDMICAAGGGHIPSALSFVDIAVFLYYKFLNISPTTISDPDRDRFILSKGHGVAALYPVLADLGFIEKSCLTTFGKNGTILGGHPDATLVDGVEASTGSLGHGLPYGVGVALAGKIDKKNYRVVVVLGDGECQEGTIWEAALFAPQHMLDNLIVIVDYNKFQAMDRVELITGLEPFADKWRAFGWAVREIDGHSFEEMESVFSELPLEAGRPTLILAHTTKGKGISYMENSALWHFRMPNPSEIETAYSDLAGGTR